MKHVFGPVPSRRLGQSLGIDPVPLKTCNWNCVYCQIGRTSPLTAERRNFIPPSDILDEVRAALHAHPEGAIDWLTIVGSGEPTLHSELGALLRGLKSLSSLPVAVLTNGSLLYRPDVRRDLLPADAVLPSLDAGSETLYRKINRAVPELSWQWLVQGLIAFRDEYAGHLWVEVMLVRGLNDGEAELRDLAAVLERVRPDEVHINVPVRPPAEPWVKVADEEHITRAAAILGAVARVVSPIAPELNLADCDDVVETIVTVIARHPMSEEDLVRALTGWNPDRVEETLKELQTSGRAHAVVRGGKRFWTSADARYVDESLSRSHGARREA
jgi:wyosine [tRNA(Phe)-imidazoG37] synthetase (radical SAM superfamily)